ncbi:FAD-dependent oxidoreductase [Microbacterium sp. ZXX196]|uniref:FAD-dependent oxidoreductase n=1 Tax=Microbacterium sp. ZXX196 TaxID=2609291 RepID=UPI0012B9AE1A|nr:FAD-dependent oxidoreductase [Microbacterium sp. ZXX196]MTE23993.1 pyridine nucleotide-disulfide oxidoreductase [Microbacterium sp. ZXX196]
MTTTKTIVVVGGVAGGMSFAARARRLDENAHIIVLERGEDVSYANCGLPYYVGGEIADRGALLVQTPESLRAALALDVRPRHEVVSLDIAAQSLTAEGPSGRVELSYDELVLAPGALAARPPIPGLDSPRVSTLRTVPDAIRLRGWVEGGARRAVVLGAGFIGVEAAEALAHAGLDVTLVELAAHVLPPLESELAVRVTDELEALGIRVVTGVGASAVHHGGEADQVELATGERIDADLVVLSIGVRPDTGFAEEAGVAAERGAIVVDERGRTSAAHVWAVGDATLSVDAATGARRPVALAGPANRAGRLVADNMLRPEKARAIPQPVGTAIVRVGSLTAALTGANRQALDSAGIAYRTLHLHPAQHAGYFPGAEQIHLVVHVAREGGRLLGAQAVGTDGVDKRIDVLATALRAGFAGEDLIDLDLAYSPPYGQAKDAVNHTGLVAQNVADGTLRLWYADEVDEVLESALVVDVRRADEWVTGHLPGALHVPHTELRDRLDEVRAQAAGRPVRVMCASGVRSAIAHRVLTQAGFDSASLSGGSITLRDHLRAASRELLTIDEGIPA